MKNIKKNIKYVLLLLLLAFLFNKCSFIKINTSSIKNYEQLYGKYGLLKNYYIGYSLGVGYNDIFPDTIPNKKNVVKFETKRSLLGDAMVGYLVIRYDEADYFNEKNRLHSLFSDKKYDFYEVKSSNKEICAVYSNCYGVIYALADDNTFEISYVDIQFEHLDEIDFTDIIEQDDLSIDFSISSARQAQDNYHKFMSNYKYDEHNIFYYLYDDIDKELLISLTPKNGYEISSFYQLHNLYEKYNHQIESVTFEKGIERFCPLTMYCAFNEPNLIHINGFENIDTSNVIDFMGCFRNCNCLDDSILKILRTDSGKFFDSMFAECDSILYFDSSNYDFSNARTLSSMFSSCNNLKEIDFSNSNFRNVYHAAGLFESCIALEKVNFSNSNFINCLHIDDMFSGCSSLKDYDFDGVIMFNIKTIDGLFNSCISLFEVDLSDLGFGILEKRSVSKKDYLSKDDFDGIFKNCSSLERIYLPKSLENKFFEFDLDFFHCDSLESIYYKDGDNLELIKSFKK